MQIHFMDISQRYILDTMVKDSIKNRVCYNEEFKAYL